MLEVLELLNETRQTFSHVLKNIEVPQGVSVSLEVSGEYPPQVRNEISQEAVIALVGPSGTPDVARGGLSRLALMRRNHGACIHTYFA
jgi:hypothetical protein